MRHKLLVDLEKKNFDRVAKKSTDETIKENKRVSYSSIINKILTKFFKKKER